MLQVLKSSDGLRVVFSLFFISTLLFVYEVTLFFKIVVPQVNTQIDNSLESIGTSQAHNLKNLFNTHTHYDDISRAQAALEPLIDAQDQSNQQVNDIKQKSQPQTHLQFEKVQNSLDPTVNSISRYYDHLQQQHRQTINENMDNFERVSQGITTAPNAPVNTIASTASTIRNSGVNVSELVRLADARSLKQYLETYKTAPEGVHKILDLFNIREKRLTRKVNDYTFYTAVILLVLFVGILLFIKFTLNGRNETIGKCAWVNIVVSLVIIFIFQYIFYRYGQVYQYMGAQGSEELVGNLLKYSLDN